jgi:hypothetical protein
VGLEDAAPLDEGGERVAGPGADPEPLDVADKTAPAARERADPLGESETTAAASLVATAPRAAAIPSPSASARETSVPLAAGTPSQQAATRATPASPFDARGSVENRRIRRGSDGFGP